MFRKAVLRPIRFYSQGEKDKLPALFLTNLLNRIDNINTNREKARLTQKQSQGEDVKAKSPNNKTDGQRDAKKAPKRPPMNKEPNSRNDKIKVSDHPLSLNWLDEGNFLKSPNTEGKVRSNRPNSAQRSLRPQRRPGNNQRLEGSTNYDKVGAATENAGDRRPRKPRSFAKAPAAARQQPPSKVTGPSRVEAKFIEAKPLQVKIDGDTFLYGKATTTQLNTSSRVAAVTKEALIKSNYPYKLPKSIIQRAPTYAVNRFLLQKNFDLHVDESWLKMRLGEVVKGDVEKLAVDKATPKELKNFAASAAAALQGNASFSFPQKRVMLSAASGLTSPKSLLANAHWVK